MTNWYRDEKKVIELAEFLVHSEEIVDTDELLEYFKHPERYTDVWNIYEREILGSEPIYFRYLKKELPRRPKQVPIIVTSILPCECTNK